MQAAIGTQPIRKSKTVVTLTLDLQELEDICLALDDSDQFGGTEFASEVLEAYRRALSFDFTESQSY